MSTTIGFKFANAVSRIAGDRTVEDRQDRTAMKEIQEKWSTKLLAGFAEDKPLSLSKDKATEISLRVEAICDVLNEKTGIKNVKAFFPHGGEFERVLCKLMDPKQPEWLSEDISADIRDHHRSQTAGKMHSRSRDDVKGVSGEVGRYARHFVGDSQLEQACFAWVYKNALNVGVLQSLGTDKRREKAADAFSAATMSTANELVDYVDQVLGHRMAVDGRMAEDAAIRRGVMPGAQSATFTGGIKAGVSEAVGNGIADGVNGVRDGLKKDIEAAVAAGISAGVSTAQSAVSPEAIAAIAAQVMKAYMAEMKADAAAAAAAHEEKAAKAKAEAEAAEAEINSRKSKA